MLFADITPEDVLLDIFKAIPPAKLMLLASAAKEPLKVRRAALNVLWSQEGGEAQKFQHELLDFWRHSPGAWMPSRSTILLRLVNAPYTVQLSGLDLLLNPSQREQVNYKSKQCALLTRQAILKDISKLKWILTNEQRGKLLNIIMTPKYEGEYFQPLASKTLDIIVAYLNPDQVDIIIKTLLADLMSPDDNIHLTAFLFIKTLKPHFSITQRAKFVQPMLDSISHKNPLVRKAAREMFLAMRHYLKTDALSACIPVILKGITQDDFYILESAAMMLVNIAPHLNSEHLSHFIEPTIMHLAHRNIMIGSFGKEILKAILPRLSVEQRASIAQRVFDRHRNESGSVPIAIMDALIFSASNLNSNQLKSFMAPLAAYLARPDFEISSELLIQHPALTPYFSAEKLGLLIAPLTDNLTLADSKAWSTLASLLKVVAPYLSMEDQSTLLKPIFNGLSCDDMEIHRAVFVILSTLMPYLKAEQIEAYVPYILEGLVHDYINVSKIAEDLMLIMAPYLKENCQQQPDVFIQPLLVRLGHQTPNTLNDGLTILSHLMPYFNSDQTEIFLPSVLSNINHESNDIRCNAIKAFLAIRAPIASELLDPFIAPILKQFTRIYYIRGDALNVFSFLLPRLNPVQLETITTLLHDDLIGYAPLTDGLDIRDSARILKALLILIPYLSPEQFEIFIEPVLNSLGSRDESLKQYASKVISALSPRLTLDQLTRFIPCVLSLGDPIIEQWTKDPLQIIRHTQDKPDLTDKEKKLLNFFIEVINNPSSSTAKRNLALQVLSSWVIDLLLKREQGCRKIDQGREFLNAMLQNIGEETRELSMLKVILDMSDVFVLPVDTNDDKMPRSPSESMIEGTSFKLFV